MNEALSALVPLTTARQCFDPIIAAHFSSNSVTSLLRDHVVPCSTRVTSPSLAGSQLGQRGQLLLCALAPPSNAGVESASVAAKRDPPVLAASAAVPPATEVRLMNSRREILVFMAVIFSLVEDSVIFTVFTSFF